MNAMKFAIPLFVALAYGPVQAQTPILGPQLSSFAVLGAETVTNVPTSTIVGNVGVSPGTAITGFNSVSGIAVADPQVTGGLVHSNTAVAAAAQGQLTTARGTLTSLGAGITLGADLAGLTLTPGIYTVAAGTTNLSGTLTLDGLGNANAFWLFQMPSTLITSSGSVVNVINAGTGSGLFWNVGSSATLGTTTSFEGNILALTSISLNTGATIGCGRALADVGSVTLQMNTISIGCAGTGEEGSNGLGGSGLVVVTPPNGGPPVVTAIPEPEIYAMMAVGLGLLGWVGRRKKLKEAAAA
jgi:hypothetical protein